MALTANDTVILVQLAMPTVKSILFGIVIAGPPNPIISWEGQPPVTYTAIAAPAFVIRTTTPAAADLLTWIFQRVNPIANVSNPSGRAQGIVVGVFLLGDPPVTLTLIVRTDEGQYYLINPSDVTIVQ